MKTFFVIIVFATLTMSQIAAQPKVTAEKVGDKIEFRVNGNLFTSYILSDFEKYPFFYPVNGPSNASVTSMRNANYPHHSSLFFGCDRVNGGNYWQETLTDGQIISLRADILKPAETKPWLKTNVSGVVPVLMHRLKTNVKLQLPFLQKTNSLLILM
jgi:hypothetical protein